MIESAKRVNTAVILRRAIYFVRPAFRVVGLPLWSKSIPPLVSGGHPTGTYFRGNLRLCNFRQYTLCLVGAGFRLGPLARLNLAYLAAACIGQRLWLAYTARAISVIGCCFATCKTKTVVCGYFPCPSTAQVMKLITLVATHVGSSFGRVWTAPDTRCDVTAWWFEGPCGFRCSGGGWWGRCG